MKRYDDKYDWLPVIEATMDEALKAVRSANACCGASALGGLSEVRKALDGAQYRIEVAQRELEKR